MHRIQTRHTSSSPIFEPCIRSTKATGTQDAIAIHQSVYHKSSSTSSRVRSHSFTHNAITNMFSATATDSDARAHVMCARLKRYMYVERDRDTPVWSFHWILDDIDAPSDDATCARTSHIHTSVNMNTSTKVQSWGLSTLGLTTARPNRGWCDTNSAVIACRWSAYLYRVREPF